ncbi:tail fiber protein [Winogradskyella eckloniae]|uniref:tail fiber protein n=1 Tax=Winogradskyella eckloniae TaxID=1089306 RepID=UPI0015632AB1|nr:tail fiber protein [Winogradskyella eckloniae]NRD18947.1 tail fiber protein [Winogradskyella eckloniae]
MNVINLRISLLFSFIIFTVNAQVGIGTTSPDNSSILEIQSSEKGVLIPRMTALERLSISAPIADGLIVYQTDDVKGFYFYDASLSTWDRMLKQTKDAIPTGAIFAFPMATPPASYLVCDGSAISRTTYSELFTVLGTTYGAGDGSTTFNLPDYRGKFLRGLDNGSGNDPDAASRQDRGDGTTGDNVGTTQDGEIKSHLHQIDAPSTTSSSDGSHSHSTYSTNTSTNNGGSHSHNTNPRSTSTNTAGSHNHSVRGEQESIATNSFGTHSDFIVDNYGDSGPGSFNTSTSGNHYHQVNIPSLSTNTTGNHNHTVTIPSLNTNSASDHTHITDIPVFDSTTAGSLETRPINTSVVYCIKF